MRRGHLLISLNPRVKTFFVGASLNWVYNCSARPAHGTTWNVSTVHSCFSRRRRADGANPRHAIPPIGLFSAFSVLLINIPPRSWRERDRVCLKAAWYHLLVGVLINPVVSAFSGAKGAGRGCSPAETTERMCSVAPFTPLIPSPNPSPSQSPIRRRRRHRCCLLVPLRPRPTDRPATPFSGSTPSRPLGRTYRRRGYHVTGQQPIDAR